MSTAILERIFNEACQENEHWLDEIRQLPIDDIILSASEITIRAEILDLLGSEGCLSDSTIHVLENMEPEDRVKRLYQTWLQSNQNFSAAINDMLDDFKQ